MAHAAQHSGHDPDLVSFIATLRIVRQSVTQQGAFPLEHPGAAQMATPNSWTRQPESCRSPAIR
jgi:transposase, IS4 family